MNILKFERGISSINDESDVLIINGHDVAEDEGGVNFLLVGLFLFFHEAQ